MKFELDEFEIELSPTLFPDLEKSAKEFKETGKSKPVKCGTIEKK